MLSVLQGLKCQIKHNTKNILIDGQSSVNVTVKFST